jgi:uncharacterized protein YlxW (UPF0749 family)
MDAPICRVCGKKHWSRVCDGDDAVTKRVTQADPVTKIVTTRQADLEIGNRRLVAENERLTTEVASLKRQLAEAHTPPKTGAERMRAHRAKAGSN